MRTSPMKPALFLVLLAGSAALCAEPPTPAAVAATDARILYMGRVRPRAAGPRWDTRESRSASPTGGLRPR